MITPLDSESLGSSSSITADAIVTAESRPHAGADEGPTELVPLVGWVVLVLICMVVGALGLALIISWIMPFILE